MKRSTEELLSKVVDWLNESVTRKVTIQAHTSGCRVSFQESFVTLSSREGDPLSAIERAFVVATQPSTRRAIVERQLMDAETDLIGARDKVSSGERIVEVLRKELKRL